MFTQQHYIELAKLVNNPMSNKAAERRLIERMCAFFAVDNPRFNRERFMAACGYDVKVTNNPKGGV